MKIVQVETYPLLHRLAEPYGDANGFKKYRSCCLIRVVTNSGVDGWGECVDWLPALMVGLRERIIPYLIGKSATDRSELIETIEKWHHRAAAAVSMALTEIAAKAAGVHVCELWGGRRTAEIPVYASFQSYTPSDQWRQQSIERVNKKVEEGFTLAKVKIGGKPFCEDKRHLVDLQALCGNRIRMIVDANQSYDSAFVRKWRELFQHWDNLMWLEEPIPFHLTGEYRFLRETMGVAIAGGENMTGAADYIPLMHERAVDIVQPDPMHHSSIDAYRESVSLARQFGFRVSPHCYDGVLSRLYAIFAQGCLAPWSKMEGESVEPVEWDVMENPLSELFTISPINGHVRIPENPGIGLEPDMERIRAHLWDGSSYEA